MIQRSVWLKTIAFVVIAVLGIGYVGIHYVGWGRTLFGGGYTAYVDLPDSGGLFTTASVTYRGVEIGRVGAITLRSNGIRVALNISSSRPIPADSQAVVGSGSPIGEQFVDLRPASDTGPYLHAGSVIPQAHTQLPVSTQDLLVNLDRLVRSVPNQDLHTVVTELGTAFADTGPTLQKLLDSTHALLTTAQTNLPQTVRLIDDSGTVLDTQQSLAPSIDAFAHGLQTFTDALRSGDHDLRAVLANGAPASTELSALDNSVDATLPVLLGNLTSLSQVSAVRVPALRQILIIYPYVVATSFGLFPGNGSTRFGVPVPPANDHQPCTQGYLSPKKRRLPTVLKYPPVRYGSFCRAPVNADINVRGSREAPEPDGKRLGNESTYRNNTGLPGGHQMLDYGVANQADAFTAPNGATYLLGSTGGQQRVLGDRSWMWLLYGPMS